MAKINRAKKNRQSTDVYYVAVSQLGQEAPWYLGLLPDCALFEFMDYPDRLIARWRQLLRPVSV